jgi:hypothetical protein
MECSLCVGVVGRVGLNIDHQLNSLPNMEKGHGSVFGIDQHLNQIKVSCYSLIFVKQFFWVGAAGTPNMLCLTFKNSQLYNY